MDTVRTHYCGKVGEADLEKSAVLFGWVHVSRDHGGVIFVELRDYTGTVQIVFDTEYNREAHTLAEKLKPEHVIAVKGAVRKRGADNVNPAIANGAVEVAVSELNVLNDCATLPFQIQEDRELGEKLRLTYRYLDLRRPTMNRNMILRSKTSKLIRDYLHDKAFHEIETPFLTKSTPEGARDYLVPSRVQAGKFFALPQSPQLFKQILMIGGMDRYFQIVKCFRDEDLRGNRQPEFTQIDMELSFPTVDEIMDICGGMMKKVFSNILGENLSAPFPIMTYDEAMNSYGSDAPDLRYDLKFKDITELASKTEFNVFASAVKNGGLVKVMRVPGGADFSRKDLDDLTEVAKIYKAKGMAWVKINNNQWQSPIAKFISDDVRREIDSLCGAEEGDLLLFGADKAKIVFDALGNVRREVAERRKLIDPDEYRFVWVVEFPLFERDEGNDRFHSTHHPFTRPVQADFDAYADSDPLAIRSEAYDLVLNGVEIGGGSLRIHDAAQQKRVFQILRLSDNEINEKFGFLMDAMKFGAPPHGGIAFGFDRLMMTLCKTDSIRDVIAFPKTQQASCLMTEAPSDVGTRQLKELGIILRSSA